MDSEFLKRLESHPAVQSLRKQDREAALAEQQRLATERATIAAGLAKQVPALVKTRDATAAAATQARAVWRKAAAEELLRAREEALSHMRRAGVVVLDVPPERAAEAVVSKYLELKRRGRL